MFHSIRTRLTVSYVLLTVLIICVLGFLSLYFIKNYAERQEKEYLRLTAQNIAGQSQLLLAQQRYSMKRLQDLADTAGFLGDVKVKIRDRTNNVLVESTMDRDRMMWLQGLEQQGFSVFESNRPITIVRKNHAFMGPLFMPRSTDKMGSPGDDLQQNPSYQSSHTLTIAVGDESSPLGFIELSNGPDFSSQLVKTARNAFLLAALGATMVSVLVGLIMGRKLTSPLMRLASAATAMGEQRWGSRAEVRGEDEIGQLASRFNEMAERLEKSFKTIARERDTLKRFIQDASHELRTPLTALTTFNELLQSKAGLKESNRNEFIEESRAQIVRLTWIVQNLLNLTRLDAFLTKLDKVECRFGEIIEHAWQTVKSKAVKKNIALNRKLPNRNISLVCDRDWFEMALCNLLDNALTFSPENGTIEVGALREDTSVLLWVKDEGPGINDEEKPHVFDRFYRAPSNTAQGSGLGLAIVKSVVEAHGGQIWVESASGNGSQFYVRLSP